MQTNPILQAIHDRRAVRHYRKDPVPKEMVDVIIDAGRMAPSAMNRQPWHFHVLDDAESILFLSAAVVKEGKLPIAKEGLREAIHAIFHPGSFHLKDALDFLQKDDPVFHGAPLVIFLSAPNNNHWASLDIGMCSENMMLAANSLGLASCPVGLATFLTNTSYYKYLHIPHDHRILIAVVFGFSDDHADGHVRRTDNVSYVGRVVQDGQ